MKKTFAFVAVVATVLVGIFGFNSVTVNGFSELNEMDGLMVETVIKTKDGNFYTSDCSEQQTFNLNQDGEYLSFTYEGKFDGNGTRFDKNNIESVSMSVCN